MSAAEPRPGLRDVEPYASPHPDVAVRLNTNESPHPLPRAFFDELAEAVRDLPLHRYPDGDLRRLRESSPAAAMHHPVEGIWAANGSNEIITQLLQAYGGPGRRAVTFEPTYLLHSRLCWLTGTDLTRLALPDGLRAGRAAGGRRGRPHRPTSLSCAHPTTRPATRSRCRRSSRSPRRCRTRW